MIIKFHSGGNLENSVYKVSLGSDNEKVVEKNHCRHSDLFFFFLNVDPQNKFVMSLYGDITILLSIFPVLYVISS